jgi:hypothetical protein
MGLVLMGGSAAIGAMGQMQQGDAAAAAASREAQSMRMNAEIAQKNAIAKDDQFRRQQRQHVGSMLAASAEAGGGLNADALRGTLYDMEMDSSTIRYEGNMKAAGLNDQASVTEWEGKQKQYGAQIGAVASLLNAGGSMMMMGAKAPSAGAPNPFAAGRKFRGDY